ncbi:hypothetical protein F4808DRAFT_476044 [Astrocystis sublimbata]|nr:hypothetical protein F4808DRAFT_476044 [Astrocystis sublimbata]
MATTASNKETRSLKALALDLESGYGAIPPRAGAEPDIASMLAEVSMLAEAVIVAAYAEVAKAKAATAVTPTTALSNNSVQSQPVQPYISKYGSFAEASDAIYCEFGRQQRDAVRRDRYSRWYCELDINKAAKQYEKEMLNLIAEYAKGQTILERYGLEGGGGAGGSFDAEFEKSLVNFLAWGRLTLLGEDVKLNKVESGSGWFATIVVWSCLVCWGIGFGFALSSE